MRKNRSGGAALVLALAASACARRDLEEAGKHRLWLGPGPTDGPMLALWVYEDADVQGCDVADGTVEELRLAFDVRDANAASYEFGASGGWGRLIDDDGEEHDVIEASLVIDSLEDDRADGSYTAVIPDRAEISDTFGNTPYCRAPQWH